MAYQKINIITGWVAFSIALLTYVLTVEPTASFWDCGEFIACSYKLEVPHPPGAPFFLLTGHMFSMLAGDDVTMVAYWVNMLSVLSSAFFVLFIFWSITHLAKRILKVKSGEVSLTDTIIIIGTGFVGALACTFSDSFWFSAVEAEVYGMSAFFTAFVFWAILKWENLENDRDRARWLILIAYMMGLSIGVHLLNLVAIPVLGLIVYFKYYEKVTTKGIVYTLLISVGIILLVLEGVIPGLPSIAGGIEIFLVNSFKLPFGSGIVLFFVLFIGSLVVAILISIQRDMYVLNTALVAFAFLMIGYASYAMVPIRSLYNPPIDENNPDDIISFVSYLKREQYGSRPLFKGPYYTSRLKNNLPGDVIYMPGKDRKGRDKYVKKDVKVNQEWDDTTLLPRMYSSEPNHIKKYLEVSGLKQGERPSQIDNFYYLIKHQIGFQYLRYFLWNFVGRASDIQGASWVGLSGLTEKLPEALAHNKGRNIYLGLPLLLGLLGMFVQYKRDVKMFAATALLFFMTGLAIVLYLNTPPIEPRERDYIYAGSFYIFTIWIGFGIFAIFDLLNKIIRNKKVTAVMATLLCLGVPILMASQNWDDHDRSERYFSIDAARNYLASCVPNAILFTGGDNDTFPLWYIQEVEGFRTDVRVVVLSYYNTDWYIEQSMRPAYKSAPLPYMLNEVHYRQGGLNDYLPVYEQPEFKGQAINAEGLLRLIETENEGIQIPTSISKYNSVPGKALFLRNYDTTYIKSLVPEIHHDKIQDRMILNIRKNALEKKDLAFLDILINSQFERPIYLNNTSLAQINLDLRSNVVQEGMTYRVLPVLNTNAAQGYLVNTDVMYDNMMNKFRWTNLDRSDIYYSEDYTGFVLNSRSTFNTLAQALIDEGDLERAREVLFRCLEVMPHESVPFDFFNVQQIDLLLKVGEEELADQVAHISSNDAQQWLDYYFGLLGFSEEEKSTRREGYMSNPTLIDVQPVDELYLQRRILTLNEIARAYRANDRREEAAMFEKLFNDYYSLFQLVAN